MADLLRASFAGSLIRLFSGGKIFQFPEEKPAFILPERYQQRAVHQRVAGATHHARTRSETTLAGDGSQGNRNGGRTPASMGCSPPQNPAAIIIPRGEDKSEGTEEGWPIDAPILVDWYGPDDPECPLNWSIFKKCFVTFDICFITFSIYIGSALYSPGQSGAAEEFGVSEVAASLGLSLFVAGYAVGPMFLSPLSEIPQLGRTCVYIITLALFVILQVPTALVPNFGGLLVLRFLSGFVGSPPLATGGASLADIWRPEDRAVAIGIWGLSAICGPVLGPVIGGFVAQANGWRWTIWVLLWLSGGALAFLVFFLPETSATAILYRRAVRLRKITGNPALKSQGEIDSANMTGKDIAMMTLVRPFILSAREPIVFAINLYIAFAYALLYCFVESFHVVFVEIYGFGLGENGLAFLGILVGAVVTYLGFVVYATKRLKPIVADVDNYQPEARLPVAMIGCWALPICLFWFGWTSRASIHWIVPIIGSSFFSVGIFLLFQAGLNYLSDAYPRYIASVLAGNDLIRSIAGAAFPLFSNAFFTNLGVGVACSILGAISIVMLPIPFLLYRFGPQLRKWSKYAD